MKHIRRFLPLAGLLIAYVLQIGIEDHIKHPEADLPYYKYFLEGLFFLILAVTAVSFFVKKLNEYLSKSGPFYFAAFLILSLLNILTAKTAFLPVLLFPSFDNVLSVFVESRELLVECVISSFKLLGLGVLWGIAVGFTAGVGIGFSRRVNYWLNPVIKIIGPIPATAWIPIVLVVFPTTFGASVFIIALAVWFPVVLLTSSGIQNVPNSYFEVGKTLGTSQFYQILRIGIPAALPNIFQGIFFGVCSAFIALMTGEMFGAKAGIGWFIHLEKEMAEFKGVYAGLILIALFCTLILTVLFKIRGRVLRWQKGLVKW